MNFFLDNPGYLATGILENGEDGNSGSRWTISGSGVTITDINDPTEPPYGKGLVVDFHAASANSSFTYKGPAQIGSAFPDTTDGQIEFQHKENGVGFLFDVSVTTAKGLVTDVQVTSGTAAPASLSGKIITVAVGPGLNLYRTQLVDLQSLISSLAGDTLSSITGFKVTLTSAGDLYFDNMSGGGLQPSNSLAFSYDVYNGAIDQAYVRVGQWPGLPTRTASTCRRRWTFRACFTCSGCSSFF